MSEGFRQATQGVRRLLMVGVAGQWIAALAGAAFSDSRLASLPEMRMTAHHGPTLRRTA